MRHFEYIVTHEDKAQEPYINVKKVNKDPQITTSARILMEFYFFT